MGAMSAPTTKTLRTTSGRTVGVQLLCPDCESICKYIALRCESAMDYPQGAAPELACRPGPLGFLLRCDRCGFRLEMHGDRIPSAALMDATWQGDPNA